MKLHTTSQKSFQIHSTKYFILFPMIMNQQWPFKEIWHFHWLCHSVESLKLRSMHYSKYMYYSPYTYSKSFSFNGPLNADSVTWLDGRCCCKDFLSILCRSSEKLCTYLSTVKKNQFCIIYANMNIQCHYKYQIFTFSNTPTNKYWPYPYFSFG